MSCARCAPAAAPAPAEYLTHDVGRQLDTLRHSTSAASRPSRPIAGDTASGFPLDGCRGSSRGTKRRAIRTRDRPHPPGHSAPRPRLGPMLNPPPRSPGCPGSAVLEPIHHHIFAVKDFFQARNVSDISDRPSRVGDVLPPCSRACRAQRLADHALWGTGHRRRSDVARHARPARLRRGVLVVRSTARVMQELQFMKHELPRLNAASAPGRRDVFLALEVVRDRTRSAAATAARRAPRCRALRLRVIRSRADRRAVDRAMPRRLRSGLQHLSLSRRIPTRASSRGS